jgi:thioredoxin 2
MMAPIFKKVAAEYMDKAVFVKVDTTAQHELSSRYNIRSLPTFQWFVGGKKINEAKGGIGEGPVSFIYYIILLSGVVGHYSFFP